MFSSTFCNQSPSFEHFLDATRIYHQDKAKQEEMKRTGSAEESGRQDQVVSKEETCSGLAGLVGLRYSRRFFYNPYLPFFEKHIFSTSERAKGRQMWKRNFRKCVWPAYALLLDFTYLYTQTKIGFGEVCRIFISEVFRFKKVTRKLQLK